MAIRTCPTCDGSGTYRGSTCQTCGGSGEVEEASREERKDLGRRTGKQAPKNPKKKGW